jgi:DNA-binding PadR family transcriptional regulator
MSKSRKAFATFSLEYLALGLVLAEPKHGYQLYAAYQETFGPIWKVGRSKFYAALATLHDSGYLSVTTEYQPDRPPRKVYAVTGSGRRHFEAWLQRPVTPMRAVRVELVAKLRFFELLDLPGLTTLLDAQRAVCQATFDTWSARLQEDLDRGDDSFMAVVYDFRLRQAQFIIEWLDACRLRLEATA